MRPRDAAVTIGNMITTVVRVLGIVLRLWWRLTMVLFLLVFGLFLFQFAVTNRTLRVASR